MMATTRSRRTGQPKTAALVRGAKRVGTDHGQRKCVFCGVNVGDTREHVAPDSRLSDRHNWAMEVPCCAPCNSAKGDRLPTEAEMEAFRRFWELEVKRIELAVAEMRQHDAQRQVTKKEPKPAKRRSTGHTASKAKPTTRTRSRKPKRRWATAYVRLPDDIDPSEIIDSVDIDLRDGYPPEDTD